MAARIISRPPWTVYFRTPDNDPVISLHMDKRWASHVNNVHYVFECNSNKRADSFICAFKIPLFLNSGSKICPISTMGLLFLVNFLIPKLKTKYLLLSSNLKLGNINNRYPTHGSHRVDTVNLSRSRN